MKAVSFLILSGVWLLVLASCRHEPINVQPGSTGSGNGTNPGSSTADTALCFERDILPIFITNCARSGCHDAASRQDGYVFTSYATITTKKFVPGNAGKTELFEKITEDDPDDIMPPPPSPRLSKRQVALIGRWINEGAKNTTGCNALCDSSRRAFAADVQPLLNTYCQGCHNSGTPSGGIVLDSYTGARSAALSGRLIGAISHSAGFSAMPQGGPKLSDCNIAQIRGWVQDGALNN
jgi:hypothetical protein